MISAEVLKAMCEARQRLERELEAPPRVSDLAAELGISTEHFIAQFRGLFGETPLQCRQRVRLERAREALALTDEPATQIAFGLGYASPGSFSRQFGQGAGMSPRAFRASGDFAQASASCITVFTRALTVGFNFGEVADSEFVHDSGTTSA